VGITTGGRVSLQAQPDGKLLIVPILEERAIKTKKIDVMGCDVKTLERNVIAAYLYGYDRIEFSSKIMLAEQKQLIRKVCYKLIDPEIIEEAQTPWLSRTSLTQMSFLSKKEYTGCFLLLDPCKRMQKELSKLSIMTLPLM
jgi:hypothetical protein